MFNKRKAYIPITTTPMANSIPITNVGMGRYASSAPIISINKELKNSRLGAILKQNRVSNKRYIIR